MRSVKIPIVLVVLAAVAYSLWPSDKPPSDDAQYLVGRLWVEREPRHERDQVHYLALIEDRQKVGSLVYASVWRVEAENFRFGLEGNRLRLRFPQENKRLNATVKTYKCKAPAPFTLCLDLTTRDRHRDLAKTFRMYSREDWVFDDGGQLADAVPGAVALQPTFSQTADLASAASTGDNDGEGPSPEMTTRLGRLLPLAPR